MGIFDTLDRVGLDVTSRVHGRLILASSGETFCATVNDAFIPPDPETSITARTQLPVYVNVIAPTGSVANPRLVTTFTEVESQRIYTVLRYEEKRGDKIAWTWFCEVQRQKFQP